MAQETETQATPFDTEKAKEKLKQILEINKVKKNSVKGRTLEYAFLHGLHVAYGEKVNMLLFLHQCGRSILD